MVRVIEEMGGDLSSEIGPVGVKLRRAQILIPTHIEAVHRDGRTPVRQPVLHGPYLAVKPIGKKGAEDPAVMGHVPVEVGSPLPHAHRCQMGRSQ